jgi:hypothetical protein
LINRCDYQFTHSVEVDENGSAIIRGLLSDSLPLSGKGTIRAINLSVATSEAEGLLETANKAVSWAIEINSDSTIDSNAVDIQVVVVSHELITVYQFQLNPFVESVWSLTALLTCFVMVLALPLGIYFASIKREQRLELVRAESDESE